MEADNTTVAANESQQEVISVLDEDEVVLYWKESNSYKYIHELASDDLDENKEVLSYYRSVQKCRLQTCNFL